MRARRPRHRRRQRPGLLHYHAVLTFALMAESGRSVGEVGPVISTGPTPLTPPGQKVMVNPSIEPVSNLKTSWTLSFQVPLAFSLEASTV
ncbi:hypothetical protein SAMN04489733_0281 [Amycolatopsis keratiniphila]|nr:hypothetical protein SAMN04489733_0281 [Amycolatopsis keratiniphila]